jgi:hypothetical protein
MTAALVQSGLVAWQARCFIGETKPTSIFPLGSFSIPSFSRRELEWGAGGRVRGTEGLIFSASGFHLTLQSPSLLFSLSGMPSVCELWTLLFNF